MVVLDIHHYYQRRVYFRKYTYMKYIHIGFIILALLFIGFILYKKEKGKELSVFEVAPIVYSFAIIVINSIVLIFIFI